MLKAVVQVQLMDVVRNPGMVSFVIDIGDPAVLQIGSIIWIVRDSRRTREELVSIGHIAEDNAMEASNAADSFIRNYAGVSDHVPDDPDLRLEPHRLHLCPYPQHISPKC